MAEENRSGLSEALETGANAAHAIKGAIKTGKALSGVAKGAAAGGPYGAVAGAVWGSRKIIGKIIIAGIALLLIPVMFVVMLPSLIFGGIKDAFFSTATDNTPVLNSGQAITENLNDIYFSINTLLGEGQDDAVLRIEADFANSGADEMEIINPYAASPTHNANQFICQYCAAKNTDIENISLADMEKILRDNKEYLFSYSVSQEQREKTEQDAAGNEITVVQTWRVYTLIYNGEGYFADNIFHLTDEQKNLAVNYAENLSLFLEDGMFQVVAWNGNVIAALGDVRYTDGVTPVVYYNQLDERYANEPYGTDNVGGYGCGPTAMAIVVSSLTGTMVNPAEMAEWSYQSGYWCKGSGSYHALIPAAADNWGLAVSGCTASEPQRILDALAEGKLVVAIMKKGHFTSGGHFIVLRGVSDGKILVADPASCTRSEQSWDFSIILNEASKQAAAGGPFWIIG